MTDFMPTKSYAERRDEQVFEVGGLRFVVCSMDYGANLAVFGDLGEGWVELIRFQDYADDPHYHAPIGGWRNFDRNELGEPLAWWLTQLESRRLATWLEESGFSDLVPSIDYEVVSGNLDQLEQAMYTCLPPEFVREPGYGVRQIDFSTDQSIFQMRNARTLEFGGLRFEVFFDRDRGASMRIFATAGEKPTEMLRLDDYDLNPHYHAPVGVWINFDRATLGEPLAWFINQVRDHLPALLEKSRYGHLIPALDFEAISSSAGDLYEAMFARVPRGCIRVPGIGLQRSNVST